ncbi:MAG: nucleotide exchange factor GrpE [Vicinamibacterales bacterium]
MIQDDDQPQDRDTTPADASGQQDSELDTLRKEKDALQDRVLRAAADFDNYRKRIERERRDLVDYAATELLVEVLPILDDLELALKQPDVPETAAYRQGVELVHRKMLDLLKKRGVTTIVAAGQTFDPNVHEAVVHEVSEHEEGTVTGELRRGYMLRDRLLRPAMVKVAKSS